MTHDYGSPILNAVYAADTTDKQRKAYNAWASDYDRDIFQYSIRTPAIAAALFTRYIAPDEGPILDAGCGTGLQGEPLALLGYGPITGIDLSEGMLETAIAKGIYAELSLATLGEPLDFADGTFANTYCTGALVPSHAPPSSFDELIHATRPGGRLVVSLRADTGAEYIEALASHIAAGRLIAEHTSPEFISLPLADPAMRNRIHMLKVLK
jgi:SAM-dependent methyltransferase